jgi:hypothetical protein
MAADGYLIEDRGAIIKFRHEITAHDAVRLHTAVYDHPRCGQVDYLIIDASEADRIARETPQVVGRVDRSFASYNPDLCVLFVPHSCGLLTRFAEYHALLRDTRWQFYALPSVDAARRFLPTLHIDLH